MIDVLRRALLAGLLVLAACKEKSRAVPLDPAPDPLGSATIRNDMAAVAAPSGAKVDRVPPAKQIAWTPPKRLPSQQEQLLAGTWAATVGEYATRSKYMADRVVLAFDPKDKGKDLVGAVVTALENDNKVQTNCIWLELRTDFTGIRRECMLVNGSPNALDQNDAITGAKSDLGTKFDWFIDSDDRNAIKFRFHDDMVVPASGPTGIRQLVFRHWTLQFDTTVPSGENRFAMVESIPEHDYAVPAKYVYEIHSGAYLDK